MADDVVQVHWMSPSGRVLIVTDLLRAPAITRRRSTRTSTPGC
jgi:hypothetical protein